jgi:8-oxo-dGTP pyrophosphatase MutT (NUDIX family)
VPGPAAEAPRRGGPQRIPRPPGHRPGDPAPWAHLDPADRRIDVDRLRTTFGTVGPPVRSPREHQVTRGSAVLAPIYDHDGETHLVLTRRSSGLRVHGGEVSFPGGGQDPGEDLRDTARREAHEEVDLDPRSVEIVGELDHLTTVTSNSFIVPYVGLLPGRPRLRASPGEVAAVLHVPLDELLDPAVYREERWDIFGGERSIYFFELVGDTVWGATAAMVRQLLGLATGTVGRGELRHV